MKRFLPFLRSKPLKLDFLEKREHFIPFRIEVLLEKMLDDPRLEPQNREPLKKLERLLSDRFHYEYHRTLVSLKNDFVPFDIDCETIEQADYTEEELGEIRDRLYESVRKILAVGNYIELEKKQLDECLKLQPIGGLSVHVDTTDFSDFHVYYRGIRERTETEQILFFWRRDRQVLSMKRVFVLAKFKSGQLIVKMFKEVAVENLKIIAPKVKLGMPIFDRIKIGGTVLGSLATTIYKLLVAAALSWILFFVVLGGLLIAAFKGVMSFLSSKTKYLHVFSSSLYYRNLSNNKAALTSLVDAAEEQEVKESLLAYFILYVNRDREMTLEEIDEQAEKWVADNFGHELDFEVDDGVRKLFEKELVFNGVGDLTRKTYKVYSIEESIRRLDETWDGFN